MLKKSFVTFLTLALTAGAAFGYTKWTWKGGTGDWDSTTNWLLDGAEPPEGWKPGSAPEGVDIEITNADAVVSYTTTADLTIQAGHKLTISGGAKLVYKVTNYAQINGELVLDNGTFDATSAETHPTQVNILGTMSLKNGGTLLAQTMGTGTDTKIVLGEGATYTYSGTMEAATFAYFKFEGGTLYCGELRAGSAVTLDGSGTINTSIFAPQTANSVVTFNGPDLIMRTGSENGFWQSGSTYIDVPESSESHFTIYSGFKTVDDVYPKTFGTSTTSPKYRYNGEILDKATFAELFTVEASSYANGDDTNYADFYLKPAAGWSLKKPTVTRTGTTATIKGTVQNVDGANGSIVYVAGVESNVVASLAQGTVVATNVKKDDTYTITISDLPSNKVYYYAVGILNAGKVVATREGAFLTSDDTVAFVGGGADANASTVGNWMGLDAVSTSTLNGKDVVIKAACTWNVNFDSSDANRIGTLTVELPETETMTLSSALRTTGACTFTSGRVVCAMDPDYFTYAKLFLLGGDYEITAEKNFSFTANKDTLVIDGSTLTINGEIPSGSVPVKNAVLMANVYTFGECTTTCTATRVCSRVRKGTVDSGRWGQVPFGTYNPNLFDLVPGTIQDNVVPPASGFQFRYDDTDWPKRTADEIYATLFGNSDHRLFLNGTQPSRETFDSEFLIINDTTAKTQLVTKYDTLPAGTTGAWTLTNGAYVRLGGNCKLGGLTLKGDVSYLDLMGKTLRVESGALKINGVAVADGEYKVSDGTLAALTGQITDSVGGGTLRVVATKPGLMVIVR